jgi:hypothetical protein
VKFNQAYSKIPFCFININRYLLTASYTLSSSNHPIRWGRKIIVKDGGDAVRLVLRSSSTWDGACVPGDTAWQAKLQANYGKYQ